MLYIFQVDTGQMLNFEMDVAISTVSSLKSKIASAHGIPVEKQVLLVSGGEILEASSRVCNYAAGTDTNPIFLFNRLNIEGSGGGGGAFPQESTFETSSGNNVNLADLETIQKQIENTNVLPPTYMSVVTRAQLAQHIHEMGREMTRKCEVLIHHQHLQHQGWAAVVANLEDIVGVFNSKVTTFVHSHDKFVQEYSADQVDAYVDGIDSTLKTLEGIRLPPGSVSSLPSHSSPKTIVTWLSEHYGNDRKDSTNMSSPLHGHLASLAASTRKTYDHVTAENFLQTLKQETNTVSEKASSPNMKEIKGLEERLYGLDQLLQEAKKLVVDQHELTQAFHQNVQRASNLRDSSIFPDLCASHQHQLLVMLKNHTQLEDIRRRCAKAKEELTINLNSRLKWVAFVQKNLSEQSAKISLYNESLKRLRVNVSVLQQIHNCERVFTVYCDEVTARGRVYARLRRLARKIAEFNEVAEVENARRVDFLSNFAGHFLSQLFCVVCEDREICTVHLPKLVEYDECADDGVGDDSEPVQIDTEKLELAARVKALEAQCAALQAQNFGLEETLREKNGAAEKQQEAMAQLAKEVEASKHEVECKSGAADRLGKQVADLKKLIDEFREKEDESIKLRNDEVARHEAVVAELEAKCEERVIELTRMLEFECSQKVKGIEEHHRLEFDALVNRFKLMNKSQAHGSSGDVCGSMSPGGGGGEHNKVVGLKRREDSRKELVFSDDETGDEDMGSDPNVILSESTTGGNGGSLERAVDAAAALFEDQPGDPTSAAKGKETDASNFVVNEYVVTVATRLHKLSRISVDTCRVGGDANLFYWNDKFNAFTVYLTHFTRNVHFLNSTASSAQEDDERRIKSLSHRNLFIANITDKEFCVARRPQNRYNVPQGFHFYRVKCKLVEVIDE